MAEAEEAKRSLEKVIAIAREREDKERRKYGVDDRTIAAAAAHHGKTRDQAKQIRSELETQRDLVAECPYCFGPLGDSPCADHVYPVIRGGLSTPDNMVLVCALCNGRKHDRTLREFIAAYDLDRDRIESVLEKLGKTF